LSETNVTIFKTERKGVTGNISQWGEEKMVVQG